MTSDGAARQPDLASYLEASATQYPDRTAVVAPDGGVLTYRELNERSDRVAGFLRSSGVTPGDRVVLLLPKNLEAVTAIFGILKVRAAYVPVDYSGPPERAASILRNCGAAAVLATPSVLAAIAAKDAGALPKVVGVVYAATSPSVHPGAVAWEQILESPRDPCPPATRKQEDVAYILNTSGSTGVPKGVTITQRNATSFVDWCTDVFTPTAEDRFSSHAPFHFDLSILDIYAAIKHGASIHLIGEDVAQNPKKLVQFVAERKLTVWYSTPSILSMMVQFGGLEGPGALRLVLFAGEVFPVKVLRELVRRWQGPAFYNLYGPTETNVCTFARIPEVVPDDRTSPYPIGQVCDHCTSVILDEDGKVVPADGEGFLYIGGASVFREYWNDPDRTKLCFREHDGTPWYNTGDVVRFEPEAGYIYLGRRDRMVKRRGFRIELGEIESALYRHEGISEAAVIAAKDADGGVKVVAFVVVRSGPPLSIIALKNFASTNLPSYMSPDVFKFLPVLPRTSTDKTDYQALLKLV